MAIAEGQFSQIGNYNIKVENKYGADGKNLENIIIHQKKQKAGNYTVIKSNKGKILSSDNSNILKLVLFDGYYYDEIISDEYKNKTNKPFIKSKFKEYVINIDIGKINQIDFDEVNDINQYSMMNINELDFAIDSLKKREK